jgi:L-fuculose-phosphate aldolase
MDTARLSAVREEVCAAGHRLVREGLVARSWGNISVRVSQDVMAITPSGIRYEEMKPEHIVMVNIADGSYEGKIKPSGERKLHLAVYRARPEIAAVIHTHQANASVCAAARIEVPVVSQRDRDILGADSISCGAYGLPGTGKLMKATAAALGQGLCALMANHGAVCIGKNIDGAFDVSMALERACGEWIAACFTRVTGMT